MATAGLAQALDRATRALERRPSAGLHDDAPGLARWTDGTRVVVRHLNGYALETDMPVELGGSGDRVSPGWLLRAGLASCAATTISMLCAREGIELDVLEVDVTSRSDTRGLLRMNGEDGAPVYSGPDQLAVRIRMAARGVAAARLRALAEEAAFVSPMVRAIEDPRDVSLVVEVA